ncbi:hypothetical protein G8A07_26095 [Roseateles sp. DAIF2]|uniref:hypothetical protein n=1 Tax=Roseateles sp. DAIF2 TaxID=2714952 RepID=UPI0018A271B1|nr:hypothetical protein [Roseateles sp. DAIF2]QPF76052.1 hypothetical protein G8A07_26095 [Roseateles sp. DAIF2]
MTMSDSSKTFLTAVLAVASAVVMALLLAERGQPEQRHTVVQLERVVVEGRSTAASAAAAAPAAMRVAELQRDEAQVRRQ